MGAELIRQESLGSAALPDTAPVKREAIRPESRRQPGFDQEFDATSLFYDCFYDPSIKAVRCIGPALLNLKKYIEKASFSWAGQSQALTTYVVNKRTTCEILVFSPDKGADTLVFSCPVLGEHEIRVSDSQCDQFEGRKVILGKVKFDKIPWIVDWMTFNVRYHGADAAVIYNHASEEFTSEELLEALSSIEGLEQVVVIEWPYKRGPRAFSSGPYKSYWDSTFCFPGINEHARFRFLKGAAGVMHCDVDELVLTQGHKSIFTMLENAPFGYLNFKGVFVSNAEDDSKTKMEDRRHRHSLMRSKKPNLECPTKWAVIPSSCPDNVTWELHAIHGHWTNYAQSNRVVYRHFRSINMGWKEDRSLHDVERIQDPGLTTAFEKIGWL